MKGVQDYARDLTSPEVKVRRHAAFQLRYFGRPALAPWKRPFGTAILWSR